MKKNLLMLGAVACLCLPGMAACGSKNPSGATPSSATPSSAAPISSAVAPSSADGTSQAAPTTSTVGSDTSCAGAPAGTIVINFWHALKNVNQQAINDLTTEFNEAHKGNVCVEMQAQNDYDTIYENMLAAIRAGTSLPDLATTYPDHVADYNTSNVVLDMEQFVFASDPEVAMPADGDDGWNDILESYRRESRNYRFTPQDLEAEYGKMYSLPLNKSTEVMYYNKTFFDYWSGKEEPKMADGTVVQDYLPTLGNNLVANIHDTGNAANDEEFNHSPYGGLISMKNDDGDTVWGKPTDFGFKNPADIDPSDVSTWWTWEDVETVGKVIQAITRQKNDIFTTSPKLYNQVTLANASTSDKIGSNVSKKGNISFSYDSSSNLFVTLANQVDSYVGLTTRQNGTATEVVPELNFDSEKALAQYGMFERLYKDGIATIPSAIGDGTLKYATTPFTSQYLFLSVGSVAGAALNSGGFFETGTAPGPQASLENPKIIQQGTNITMIGRNGRNFNINSTDPADAPKIAKAKATWEYVKYITGHHANLYFATNTAYMPTRVSVFNDPEYQDWLNVDKAERKALKTAIAISQTNCLFTDPPFKGSGTLRNNAENVIKNALTGSSTNIRTEITKYCEEQRKTLLGQ